LRLPLLREAPPMFWVQTAPPRQLYSRGLLPRPEWILATPILFSFVFTGRLISLPSFAVEESPGRSFKRGVICFFPSPTPPSGPLFKLPRFLRWLASPALNFSKGLFDYFQACLLPFWVLPPFLLGIPLSSHYPGHSGRFDSHPFWAALLTTSF